MDNGSGVVTRPLGGNGVAGRPPSALLKTAEQGWPGRHPLASGRKRLPARLGLLIPARAPSGPSVRGPVVQAGAQLTQEWEGAVSPGAEACYDPGLLGGGGSPEAPHL